MKSSTPLVDLRIAVLLLGTLALAGCGASSDLTGTARHPVSFSVTTRTTTAGANLVSPDSRSDLVLGTNGELVLTKIQLVLSRLELTRSDATSCVSDDSTSDDHSGRDGAEDDHAGRDSAEAEHGGCEHVSASPIVVDVPVDAAVHTAINVPLNAGTYTKLEARLAPSARVTAANPELAGASVRITGTFNGKAFTFTSDLHRKIEMKLNPPLVIDATTKNATINIDVSSWFKSRDGALIDPATANRGGANEARVVSNIRTSFRAFEDDDRGGDDDHGRRHGG